VYFEEIMFRRFVLILALVMACGVATAHGEQRMALVIGEAAYKRAPLANATNDARLIASQLKILQFEVFAHYDVGLRDMKRAVQAFSAALKAGGKDSVAFIYYAGHGVQVKGENYLIPVDETINGEGDVDIDSVSVSSLMSMLDHAETSVNVIIFDACRINPFGYARGGERGLARVDAPRGSLVAFSTSPGKVAADGKGGNSPYTAALAQAIAEPGARIEDVFKKVRVAVSAATGGEQTPWESTSLTGDFYPAGGAGVTPVAKPTAPDGEEDARSEWGAVDKTSLAMLEIFLKHYGASRYAKYAAARIDELKAQQAAQEAKLREKEENPRENNEKQRSPKGDREDLQQDEPELTPPSFSCAKHDIEPIERLICSDSELSKWDGRLGRAYREAMARSASQTELRQSQRDWIKMRYATCNVPTKGQWAVAQLAHAKPCILRMTRARAVQLEGF
jgi:uncharacterized protein YecT (DUF1311 family)